MLENSELGKKSQYIDRYDNSLLFPIPREIKREEISIPKGYKFYGSDIWIGFEISWLNAKGKPIVKIGRFTIDSNSENIIESKSFKLYLNSFNNTVINSDSDALKMMQNDLSKAANGTVNVELFNLDEFDSEISYLGGMCLDDLDIQVDNYEVDTTILKSSDTKVSEELYSNLLKSNCLVTGQPDWGSVYIKYEGNQIHKESLLQYIISFRNHNEFHEQCVERIYNDILKTLKPEKLLVYARYTRRGGLDINPIRSNYNYDQNIHKIRLIRQ